MHTHRKSHGFTLAEILVVLTIIGLFSAFLLPNFLSSRSTAEAGSIAEQARRLNLATQHYQLGGGTIDPGDALRAFNQLQAGIEADTARRGPALGALIPSQYRLVACDDSNRSPCLFYAGGHWTHLSSGSGYRLFAGSEQVVIPEQGWNLEGARFALSSEKPWVWHYDDAVVTGQLPYISRPGDTVWVPVTPKITIPGAPTFTIPPVPTTVSTPTPTHPPTTPPPTTPTPTPPITPTPPPDPTPTPDPEADLYWASPSIGRIYDGWVLNQRSVYSMSLVGTNVSQLAFTVAFSGTYSRGGVDEPWTTNVPAPLSGSGSGQLSTLVDLRIPALDAIDGQIVLSGTAVKTSDGSPVSVVRTIYVRIPAGGVPVITPTPPVITPTPTPPVITPTPTPPVITPTPTIPPPTPTPTIPKKTLTSLLVSSTVDNFEDLPSALRGGEQTEETWVMTGNNAFEIDGLSTHPVSSAAKPTVGGKVARELYGIPSEVTYSLSFKRWEWRAPSNALVLGAALPSGAGGNATVGPAELNEVKYPAYELRAVYHVDTTESAPMPYPWTQFNLNFDFPAAGGDSSTVTGSGTAALIVGASGYWCREVDINGQRYPLVEHPQSPGSFSTGDISLPFTTTNPVLQGKPNSYLLRAVGLDDVVINNASTERNPNEMKVTLNPVDNAGAPAPEPTYQPRASISGQTVTVVSGWLPAENSYQINLELSSPQSARGDATPIGGSLQVTGGGGASGGPQYKEYTRTFTLPTINGYHYVLSPVIRKL